MPTTTAGVFTIDYTLRTNAEPGNDIQFGMDFQVTQSGVALPLCQLIFPATSVGTNVAGQWNIDNHAAPSTDPMCLVFGNAGDGTITDMPTEISKRDKGILTTRFTVYRVDVARNVVQTSGVAFGYRIDTSASEAATTIIEAVKIALPREQQALIRQRCSTIRFS